MADKKLHFGTCTLCEAMCGIEVKHDGKKVLSIKGDKNDPFSKGYICPKATALQDLYEDPDRLRQPVEKTAEGWKEISWPEALDKVASISYPIILFVCTYLATCCAFLYRM